LRNVIGTAYLPTFFRKWVHVSLCSLKNKKIVTWIRVVLFAKSDNEWHEREIKWNDYKEYVTEME
ncbi:hypothetical protein, partial [Enterococcus faecium]